MFDIFKKSERNTEAVASEYRVEEVLPPNDDELTSVRLFARIGPRTEGNARRVPDSDRVRLYRSYQGLARNETDKKRFEMLADYFARRAARYG